MTLIRTILVIDGDRAWQNLSRRFARRGVSIDWTPDAEEGLARSIVTKPDLAVIGMDHDVKNSLKVMEAIHETSPKTLFFVVSERADAYTAVECMRRGAMDFILRPLAFEPLCESIESAQKYLQNVCIGMTPSTECVVSEHKVITLGNRLEELPYIINQAVLNAGIVCPDVEMLKMALGEILLNAIEHGNLGITMEEKSRAVKKGTYDRLVQRRLMDPAMAGRNVTLEVVMDRDRLEYIVTDEGDGFDYQKETGVDPGSRIGSGLGIQIARSFFHEVRYEGKGNRVHLVYQRDHTKQGGYASKRRSTSPSAHAPRTGEKRTLPVSDGAVASQGLAIDVDLIDKITRSFPFGLLLVTDKGRIAMWNHRAEQITSIPASDLVGSTVANAPEVVRLIASGPGGHVSIPGDDLDARVIEKSVHTVEAGRGVRYTVVLFSDITETIRQHEEMERLLMESAETKDLMEEQAARLAITLAEMEEKNEIIRAQNQRMVEELEMAARLQKSLLPDTFENKNGVSFSCKYIPSIHIGGDLYDVVDLGGGQTGFIIADVSGHGVAAALVSAMFKMSFHALATTVASPSILMHVLNNELRPVLDEDYITAFFVITDRFAKSITYTNAAHPCPLLYKHSSKEIIELDTDGFFLGAFDDGGYEEKTLQDIETGDALFLYTDCILETENDKGEQYGKERLKAFLAGHMPALRGNDLIEAVEADLRAFSGKENFDDDFTVMLLEFWEEVSAEDATTSEDSTGGFVEF